MSPNRVLLGDNLELMRAEPAESVQMAYLDPPFNTGSDRTRRTLATTADVNGDRTGFGGRRYATRLLEESSYRDAFDDDLGFLEPRLLEVRCRVPGQTAHRRLGPRRPPSGIRMPLPSSPTRQVRAPWL